MGFAVLVILAGIAAVVASLTQRRFSRLRLPGVAGIVVGALLWLTAAALIGVPVGSVAVIVNRFTGLKPDALAPGTHFILPGVEVPFYYNTRLQELTLSRRGEGGANLDESIKALSKEGLEISVDVTVQYQVIGSKAPVIHQEIGPDFEQVIIRPQVRSEVRNGIGQFNAAELISTKRKELETLIVKNLEAAFQKANIDLRAILLREVRIPESVAKAIEEKQTAEQRVQTERNNRDAERIRADTAVVKAEGESKAAVARAQGEARSIALRGAALRQNPQLIQLTVAEKLAPSIQTVMIPSNGNFLLNLQDLTRTSAAPATR
jgi:regulator of protease activity HflC (stomatin/prohibitin superfamily)